MKCTIQGCRGEYQTRRILHVGKSGNDVMAIENVPAEVCPECGDTMMKPATIHRIEELFMKPPEKPRTTILVDFVEGE